MQIALNVCFSVFNHYSLKVPGKIIQADLRNIHSFNYINRMVINYYAAHVPLGLHNSSNLDYIYDLILKYLNLI